MSIRSEREKSKMQEKYQIILAQMLKEDDNRFCGDCDTKSLFKSMIIVCLKTKFLFFSFRPSMDKLEFRHFYLYTLCWISSQFRCSYFESKIG